MQLPAAPATFRELRVRPWGGGLGRRHPGIVSPNRVIFRLKNVCGNVSGRWTERKQKDPRHRGEGCPSGEAPRPQAWGGTWGQRSAGWPSLGLAKLRGSGRAGAGRGGSV